MTVQVFDGSPEALKARLDALILATATIDFIFPSHQKGRYIIIYTP